MSGLSDPSILVTLAFYAASAITIASSLLVVLQRDLVRSVVALTFSFIGVAAIFFILNAEFIGVVQILVYVGAISILIAFAVMFIRDLTSAGTLSQNALISALTTLLLLALIVFVIYNTEWRDIDQVSNPDAVAGLTGEYIEVDRGDGDVIVQASQPGAQEASDGILIDSTAPIGSLLIRNFILPFEALGFLLVAALLGALVIIRERRREDEAR